MLRGAYVALRNTASSADSKLNYLLLCSLQKYITFIYQGGDRRMEKVKEELLPPTEVHGFCGEFLLSQLCKAL